jgi:hypothetical protein
LRPVKIYPQMRQGDCLVPAPLAAFADQDRSRLAALGQQPLARQRVVGLEREESCSGFMYREHTENVLCGGAGEDADHVT